jgi:hypothetical protein
LKRALADVDAWMRDPGMCRSQRDAFVLRARRFGDVYSGLARLQSPSFSTDYWHSINAELERRLIPRPPIGFLRDRLIAGTMFIDRRGRLLREELSYLESRIEPDRLAELLREDYVGRPPLIRRYRTSHNTVHHLYHLERYREATGCDLAGFRTVVEWGGGYGNLAKLFRRVSGGRCTYVIIDNPLFVALQWLYLGTILGEASVNLVSAHEAPLTQGALNLVPVGLVGVLDSARADLFISTWALSETGPDGQEQVFSRDWFGAKRLLLACQRSSTDFAAADRVTAAAMAEGAMISDIELLPGNCYAFA